MILVLKWPRSHGEFSVQSLYRYIIHLILDDLWILYYLWEIHRFDKYQDLKGKRIS